MRRGVDCNRTLKLLPCCEQPRWLSSCLKHIKLPWLSCGSTPRGALSHRGRSLLYIEERARHRKSGASCRTSRTRSPRGRASEYAVDLGGLYKIMRRMPREEQAIDLKYLIKSEAEAYERNVLECQLSSDVGPESEYAATKPRRPRASNRIISRASMKRTAATHLP